MSSNVHILTGCGGTGVTTLLRTLELMVEDPYWRPRLHRDIYFILIDTDRKDIQNFKRRKSELLAGLPHEPYLLVHNLAQNISHLQQPVLSRFRANDESPDAIKGRDRLLRHWWNRSASEPFYAPWVDDIVQGAGQCGPVSYFLSWLRMPEFDVALKDLLREIETRQGGLGPWKVLNSLIVSGLAGGTGRGCWQWIGFKIRDFFARQGHSPAPTGFLIDQSAFEDRKRSRPRTAVAMTVNSLTGLSELSGWITNQRAENHKDVYRFRLPSFHSPANEVSDVIQPDPESNQWHGGPINSVHLIFGSNGQTHLASAEQYFEMVGTGIYCAISNSDIQAQNINDRGSAHYYSMASATVEVKANQIRKFFEWTARAEAIHRLRNRDDSVADRAAGEFLKQNKLQLGLLSATSRSAKVDSPFEPDAHGTPLQRLLAFIDGARAKFKNALNEAFDSDDTDLVLDAAGQLSGERESLIADARQKLKAAFDEVRIASFDEVEPEMQTFPVGPALAAAKQLYERTGSVANMLQFLKRTRQTFEYERESLNAVTESTHREIDSLINQVSGRSYALFGERFDDAEETEIKSACDIQFLAKNDEHIRMYLKSIYAEWIGKLRSLEERLELYLESLGAAEILLRDRCDAVVPGTTDARSLLFSKEDKPEDSAIDPLHPERFFRRTLQPVISDARINELVEPMVAKSSVLTSLVSDAFKPLDKDAYVRQQTGRNQRDRLVAEVTQVVRVNDDFMPREFALRKVAYDLAKAWCKRLDGAVSSDERNYLTDLCYATLGFKPQTQKSRDEIQHVLPTEEDIIHYLAAATAKNCKPYWQIRSDALVHPFSVSLFFVTDLSEDESKAKLQPLLTDRPVNIDVNARTNNDQHSGHNPYVLLAYSNEGIDSLEPIQSARYHEEENIETLIKQTENPSGDTIFQRGIGYTSPIFVTEPAISSKRWKPWAKDLRFEENQRQGRVMDAILYSLFPGKSDDAHVVDLLSKLSHCDWPMSLFEPQDRNYFKVARLPRIWQGGRSAIDQQTSHLDGWSEGSNVASSAGIANVLKRLEESPAWVGRIHQETEMFLDDVLPFLGYGPTTPARKAVFAAFQGWLRSEMDDADKNKDEAAREIWSTLLQRAAQWGISG
ncbi:tubulin-like doman-containing protein [Stieleria varia]|uniref:Tubulin-like protein n=1 Tax=Stieleria varia TaxID=2528005 RepID=A0A5C5ZTF6_9BACT|nr:tubulin-like doman-containing protein [Stieleria varia]TWT89483.1 Tubulin-like protein [Stieleria varia]